MASVTVETTKLKSALERLYQRFNRRVNVEGDPLGFLYRYSDPRDQEIVGFIASSLSFGNARQIVRSISCVLEPMGPAPARYLTHSRPASIAGDCGGFKHRWVTGENVATMLNGLGSVLRRYGSLEACFKQGLHEKDKDIIPSLTRFVDEISGRSSGGMQYLLPSPCRKSACKRLNLFLRWMVRSDEVDPGVWSGIPASKLIVPLDTHVFRLSRTMGLTGRNQADIRSAREITDGFRAIAPDDPVRYDFSLASLGMRGGDGEKAFLRELGLREAV
ncbi:MAG: TIGR02757 family protein [bacterium]|nr:MAG: TIGR02757 family protein [bacterium]